MQNALLEYYYQFHTQQHYFLCHDILEEAWKAQDQYGKQDFVVGLILFATASYHYRRGNFRGALRTYRKAGNIFNQYSDTVMTQFGIDGMAFRQLIKQLIADINLEKLFTPIRLPLLDDTIQTLTAQYHDYTVRKDIVSTPDILDHHRNRDRSSVIRAREVAYQLRHP